MISLLYVDDEPALLELVKNILEGSAEFTVDTKSSAQEGLNALSSRPYDAIVADYSMPEIDGIAFLYQVRQQYGDIPFIILTGRGKEEVVIKALNSGADFYLQKGGDFKVVLTELKHILKQCIAIRNTKKNLIEREERYHDLQNANDLIQSVAPDGHFFFVNQKWLDTLGYQEEDLENINIFSIIHEESLDHCMTTFKRVISGENVGIIDAVFKTRNGNKVYVEGIANCRMKDGKPEYTRGIFKDITDRKTAEAALRESEERFRALVETTRDMVWEVGNNERYTYVSPQVLEILGYRPEEVIGKTCYDLMPPDEAEKTRKKISESASVGKPIIRLENVNLHKDGRLIILETSGEPVLAADGSIVGYRGIDRDITERKRAEEVIRKSENYLKTLLESIPAGVIVVDAQTHIILHANPSALALFGASAEYVLGKICHNFICPTANGHCPISDKGMHIDKSERILLNTSGEQINIIKSVTRANLNDQEVLIETFVDISDRKRAEEALQESEDRYRMLVENANEAIFVIQDGRICFANPKLEQIGKYTLEELSQKSFLEFVYPDDRTLVAEQHKQRLLGEPLKEDYSFRIISKDGSVFWMKISASRISWKGRAAVLVLLSDITERKATESAFQAIVWSMVGSTGHNSFRKITENLSSWLGADCVMVGEIQPDNQTVKVLSMLLDGKEIFDFTYTLKGTPCDNVAERGFCLYPDNAIKLFPESKDLVELNIRGYIGAPLRNSSGQVCGILCALFRSPIQSSPSMQEIMEIIAVKASAEIERKQAETALLESEEKFRSLVEYALDGILILDFQGTILFNNRAAVRLIEADYSTEFVGRNVLEFIAPESRENAIYDFMQVSKGHDAYLAQYNTISSKGNKFWVESIGKVINFHKAPSILLSIRDITERKRAEDALRQANKQINLLSSITRHDILNQLMVLKGYLELSQEVIDKPEILSGYIKKEQLAAHAIQNQITFTRDYQELGVTAPTWQNVNASIQKALTMIPVQKIRVDVDRTDLEIFADRLFEKVFYNLIDNALRYGGDQLKTIRISSQESDGHLTLVCEDDGTGISDKDKKRLFTRGFGKNTGLGLFLSREILSITGITINENGIPGKGARFEIIVTKGAYRFT
ncbi:MAG: PAS domain S-box protein [Methanoregula sp.]|nr:PAS domain S-box protein [Methanoregula sp.]